MWEHSKTIGALTWREIADRIVNWTDVVFIICTDSSTTSWGQGQEIGYALNNRVKAITVGIDGASIPVELSAPNFENWQGDDFATRCTALASGLPGTMERLLGLDESTVSRQRPPALAERRRHLKELNMNIAALDLQRVTEGKKAISDSYLQETVRGQVALIAQDKGPDDPTFSTIGLSEARKLEDFNSTSFYWNLYFAEMGRALAAGEQHYLQGTIKQHIDSDMTTISRSKPSFELLEARVERLSQVGVKPDVMLAPIEVYVPFATRFVSQMNWAEGERERVTLGGAQLKVFWSHKYAPSTSFIILDRAAGIWHVAADGETGQLFTAVIGQNPAYTDRVLIGAETTVRYEITQPDSFCVIDLSD